MIDGHEGYVNSRPRHSTVRAAIMAASCTIEKENAPTTCRPIVRCHPSVSGENRFAILKIAEVSVAGTYQYQRFSTSVRHISNGIGSLTLRTLMRYDWRVEKTPSRVAAPNTKRAGGVQAFCMCNDYRRRMRSTSSLDSLATTGHTKTAISPSKHGVRH